MDESTSVMLKGLFLLTTAILQMISSSRQVNSFGSQFDYFQDDYDVKLERLEIGRVNPTIIKYLHAGFVPYNRTLRVFNGTLTTLRDGMTSKLDIQLYKFLSNEYRFFPLSISVNACKEYSLNAIGIKELLTRQSNLDPCHINKDVEYHIYNAYPDMSRLPPHIPRGRYKMSFKFFGHANDFLFETFAYAEIKDKAMTWN